MSKYKLNIDTLDTESALEALDIIGSLADEKGIDWALCGGVAMQVYGSDRLTKDLDFIASQTLPLSVVRRLTFGGDRYAVKTKRQTVDVDWIKRFDSWKDLYQAALRDAIVINGTPIVTPEWMVLLKWFAGRYKDQVDAVFLLETGKVNRRLLKANFVKVRGQREWSTIFGGLSRWFDLADKFIRDGDENESYRSEDDYLDS